MRPIHLLAPLAAATTLPRQAPAAPARTKLLLGAPNQVLVADFDGAAFSVVANATDEGTNPSWLAFKEPNLVYAVDEMNAVTNLFVVSAIRFLQKPRQGTGKRLTCNSLIIRRIHCRRCRAPRAARAAWCTSSGTSTRHAS